MWINKTFTDLSTLELFEIYKLRTEVFVVEQNCPYQEVDNLDLIATHLFAKNCENLTAYARIIPNQDYVQIGRVLVAKEYRGSGLARELMLQAVEIASSYDQPIKIQAQAYLQSFYESLGFIAISDIYLEDGIPHLDMQLVCC
ncbi:GNAT family N-acetyltransferase [Actinobacillus genomosp. 2]|uniref:GNAT family N-acetyltransferase n=1 Tax=Actinobacillus genomosp. 2 TaxID=230709 RepID=UPI002441EC84|nr:GNAT family N-acetyltransferase [Actinobacillus genomosp. 2]WGE31922.1 GNAT family N-acetyltransferase [Actinobacillus genomosp. 2]